MLPHLRRVPYDPVASFEPVAMVATYLAVVTVRNELPAKSFAEFVALAKKEPGKLTYGSAGVASFGNMAGETIKLRQGVDVLHVPFKGSGDLVAALLGGQIDIIIDGVGLPLGRRAARRARSPRSPTSAIRNCRRSRRSPRRGSRPGCRAPGGRSTRPKGTPEPIVKRLDAALARILAEPDTKERMNRISVIASYRRRPRRAS